MLKPKRRGSQGAGGFTLVEVMLALGMLTLTMMAFLSLCLSTVNSNRQTEMRVAGGKAIASQYNLLVGVAGNKENTRYAGNGPKALLSYMREVRDKLSSGVFNPDYPFKFNLDEASGVLQYEFMVPAHGMRAFGINDSAADAIRYQHPRARGVVIMYLRENNVPEHFRDWLTIYDGAPDAPANLGWFDMDDDDVGSGNFTDLLTRSSPNFSESTLQRIPVTIIVRYYSSDESLNADRDPSGGFIMGNINDTERSGNSLVSITRDYIINSEASLASAAGH